MTPLGPAPVIARWALVRLLPRELRDDVVANLEDLYRIRARQRGRLAADAWYWRQAFSMPCRLRLAGDVPRPFSTRTTIMRSIVQDLRYAWRLHRGRPAFSAIAILSLAVGIGLNTAIFSVVNAVLLRPVPVEHVDRLVMIWETDRNTGTTREPGSLPDFLDYRDRARTLDAIGALIAREVNLTPPGGEPSRLASLVVSEDLLPMLGLQPRMGRALAASDMLPGSAQVALISESLWARTFDRAPDVVGRPLVIDEQTFTVAGVVDDRTDFGVLQILGSAAYSRSFADRGTRVRVDVWTPLRATPDSLPRSTHPLFMVGRLAPTATLDAARAELTQLAADLEREYPQDNIGRGVNLESLDAVVFGPVRPALLALLGAVALVLLVACVNVANLLLAMGAARQREIAVRVALGAARGRLIRQLLTESVALAVVAGTLGVGLAYAALAWLVALAPAHIPRLASTTIDLSVLTVTVGVSVGAGVLFGLFPALQARAAAPGHALTSEGTRSATSGRDGSRLRAGLVVAELALAVILVVGAGLLMRSFWHLQQIDPGFQSRDAMKAEFQLPGTRYPVNFAVWPNFQEIHRFNADVLARAAALPGIERVAIAGNHPLDPGFTNSFTVVGREAESRTFPEISVRRVTPGYFDTVSLALRAGRSLEAGDTTDGAPVLVINEAAAERFFQDGDPIGHEIALWGSNRRIVGIVGDELFQGITSDRPLAVYLPLTQSPSTNGAGVLLARVAPGVDPASLGPSLARVIHEVDPALAVFGLEPLDQTLARSMGESRFTMWLLGLFAAMALGLAAVGIHGVLTYSVSARARELGIRLALGARPEALRRRVVGYGLVLAATGLAIGALGAVLLTRVLQSLLYAVTPTDPATFGGMAALLLLVAAAASYLPARRITRIDPGVAMRD